ncbi:MAG: ABC transporter permease subunit [Candidatus Puniceispirillales bacterium]
MAQSFSEITYKYNNRVIDNIGLSVTLLLLLVIICSILSLLISGFKSDDSYLTIHDILEILKFTFLQSFLSVLSSLLLGIYVAKILIKIKSSFIKTVLLSLSSVAFVIPTVVAGIGIIKVWGGNGLLGLIEFFFGFNDNELFLFGLFGILLAHIFFNAPLFLRVFYSCLDSIPENYLKNSTQLNLNGLNYFKVIEWPFIKPVLPLLTGIVFLQCFTSFSLILMLGGGPSSSTLEVAIYTAVRYDFDLQSAAILAIFQLFICLVILIILDNFQKNKISNIQIEIISKNYTNRSSKNFLEKFFNVIFLLVYFILVLSPLILLIISGINLEIVNILKSPRTLEVFTNSMAIALVSSFITVLVSWSICEARTNLIIKSELGYNKLVILKFFNLSILMYLAVPSIVMGTGLFIILKGMVSYNYFPIIILIFSNVMLCLPFTVNIIQSKSIFLRRKHDLLCASLGIDGINRFLNIDFPSLRHVFGFSLGISACLSLGDLSVIALFGSENFQTIPWLIFQYMSSYKIDEASSVSTLLIALCFIIFYFFSRYVGGKDA